MTQAEDFKWAKNWAKNWPNFSGHFRASLAQRARRGILMPRGKNCRETMFAAQLLRKYPRRGGYFERGEIASLVGERQFGVTFKREFGRG